MRSDALGLPVEVTVEREEQLEAVLSHPAPSVIYLDTAAFSKAFLEKGFQRIRSAGRKAGLRLRRIHRADEEAEAACITQLKPDCLLVRDAEGLELAGELRENGGEAVEVSADHTLYGYNPLSAGYLIRSGADRLTFPAELTARELKALYGAMPDIPYTLTVYGHIPMMVSANCVKKTTQGCDKKNSIVKLRDRTAKDMPVRCYCGPCYNQIFNADPLVLYDLPEEVKGLKPDRVRYDFTIEDSGKVMRILNGELPPAFTRGHFRNGIM